MKILLVALNAKYIHSNLAVHSLKAYAKKLATNIALVEMTINHSEEDILKAIYKEKADIVAFSCYIWNIAMTTRIASELKKIRPDVRIWFGGPEVSYDAQKCLKDLKALDGIIIGEGEQTFLELMEYYVERRTKLHSIDGLAFKENAKLASDVSIEEAAEADQDMITTTGTRKLISLDQIPFPYEDMEAFHNKIIYYESSRGCPFSCSYCLSSIDKSVRLRSTDLVKKELKLFMNYQVPQVKFVDRTFNCNRKHAMEIWSFIKEQDNGITNFHFEISADLLEDEEIEFLNTLRPGQVQFEIGVQTTNPDTVKAIRRKMDLEKLSRNVTLIRRGDNIHQHLDLIAGLPLEGLTSFEKSFNEVYNLMPDQLQLGFLKVLKGALMEMESDAYGITYRDTPPYEVLYTSDLTYEEVQKIKGVCEMVEIYYNSGQFTYTIKYLKHFYPSAFQLYQKLNEFYESNAIAMMSHSRIKRYDILLDFYKEIVLESGGAEDGLSLVTLFKELLVLDLYLREDLKSRPAFAHGNLHQSKLREMYNKYQKDRKAIHLEQFSFDVFSAADFGLVIRKDMTLLFDYSDRDPLNKAARLTVLE